MVNSLLFTIQLTFISRLKENTTEISSPLRHWAQEILLGPMNGEICIAGSFSLAAAGEAVGTHCPSLPALPWASGPALREQQLWTQLAADVKSRPSVMCVREGPEGPVQRQQSPRGDRQPERCQRTGSGAVRGRLGPGGAQERRERPGRDTAAAAARACGGQQCRQQGQEGATRRNGCDK